MQNRDKKSEKEKHKNIFFFQIKNWNNLTLWRVRQQYGHTQYLYWMTEKERKIGSIYWIRYIDHTHIHTVVSYWQTRTANTTQWHWKLKMLLLLLLLLLIWCIFPFSSYLSLLQQCCDEQHQRVAPYKGCTREHVWLCVYLHIQISFILFIYFPFVSSRVLFLLCVYFFVHLFMSFIKYELFPSRCSSK